MRARWRLRYRNERAGGCAIEMTVVVPGQRTIKRGLTERERRELRCAGSCAKVR